MIAARARVSPFDSATKMLLYHVDGPHSGTSSITTIPGRTVAASNWNKDWSVKMQTLYQYGYQHQ